jgi:HD superfamily phosphodiesterase
MMNHSSIIEKSKIYVEELFDKKVSKDYCYHNYEHTINVFEASLKLAKHSKLSENDTEILLLSSLFHDTGFSVDRESHEEHSKQIAKDFLEKESYNQEKVNIILECIDATKKDEEPKTQLQKIMKDADLSGLSSKDYQKHAEHIRKELNHFSDEKISKEKWKQVNYEFIKNNKYYSESAKQLFGPLKLENQKSLETMLEQKKDKIKKPKILTIANSKSGQTQFKTALRNHIDLSAIADNKANIMLSVNALIITVALPILAETVIEMPIFLYPTISLLCVSVTSMIFATLATRPIKMKGNTTIDDVRLKRSNLFFFGNFYNMKFNDYEEGIKQVIAEDDVLNNAITRDLFYLGKALGSKYNNLRWCYNIFMFGVIFTVVLFGVVFIIQNN